jgi:hypothetical protein
MTLPDESTISTEVSMGEPPPVTDTDCWPSCTEPKSASGPIWLVEVLKGASSIHSAEAPAPL